MKQPIKGFLAGGVLALALFGVAAAGPLEDGEAAYLRGDYATAMSLLRPLAERGNAVAQARPRLDVREGPRRAAGLRAGRRVVPQGRRAGKRRRAVQPRRDVRAWPRRAAGLRAGRRVVPQGRRAGERRRAVQFRRDVREGRGRAAGLRAGRRVVPQGRRAGERRRRSPTSV